MERPSDKLFTDFWLEKYSAFREGPWYKFNELHRVPGDRWNTAIAIMPNNIEARRYKYLDDAVKPEERHLKDLGRNFSGTTFSSFCNQVGFSTAETFSVETVKEYYAKLCKIEFPEVSSRPRDFNPDEKLEFAEYNKAFIPYAHPYIWEHIVFPYDFHAVYPIPLFQPQASIYFLTRIRAPEQYGNRTMPSHLEPEEDILLRGNSNSAGINSFLNQFLAYPGFREWERSVNAELSILRFRGFFKDLDFFLRKTDLPWDIALLKSLPTLIRGETKQVAPETLSTHATNKNLIVLDLNQWVKNAAYVIDTSVGWTEITKGREHLKQQYVDFVPEIVALMTGITDQELHKKYYHIMKQIENPLQSLTEALNQTHLQTQQIRAILFSPRRGIFAAQQEVRELFWGESIANPDGSQTEILHQPQDYGKQADLKDAQWVLSHALGRLMGCQLEGNDPVTALNGVCSYLKDSFTDNNTTRQRYAKAIYHLLEIQNNDLTDLCRDNPIRLLNRIKSNLYTPFKPDESQQPIKWAVLNALIPEINGVSATLNDNPLETAVLPATATITEDANPLPHQGHLLEFICGLIDANRPSEVRARLALHGDSPQKPKKVAFELTSDHKWLIEGSIDSLKTFLERLEKVRSLGATVQEDYGDFRRPFKVLYDRCDKDMLPRIGGNGAVLSLNWANLKIVFDGQKLLLESEKENDR